MTVGSTDDLDRPSAALEAFFRSILATFGLESLAGFAAQQAAAGVGEAEFLTNLENQEAYRIQFAPIFQRRELGLPPITPIEVLDMRRRVAELEEFYELPEGTIDPDRALVNNRSFNEIQAHVAFTARLRDEEDPAVLAELENMGVSSGGILAFGLNPDATLGRLEEQVRIAQISVGSRSGGVELTAQEAAQLEAQGVTRQDVTNRAAALTTAGDLRTGVGGMFGGLERELELGLLEGSSLALDALRRRARQVQSRFEGGGGFRTDRSGGAFGLGSA